MGEIKQRDYVFDTLRGLCMWSIPISHFTRVAGHFSHASLGGVVYITINVFVMQAFMFLSGYFSKKPDRSREIAFKTFLWPYILSIFFFYGVRQLFWGNATLYFDMAPFAMWFMFTLFLYKVFQKNYIKIPHFFAITFVLYLVAGCLPFLTEFMSLGRVISYFPFFFLGYYCTPEHIAKDKMPEKMAERSVSGGTCGNFRMACLWSDRDSGGLVSAESSGFIYRCILVCRHFDEIASCIPRLCMDYSDVQHSAEP